MGRRARRAGQTQLGLLVARGGEGERAASVNACGGSGGALVSGGTRSLVSLLSEPRLSSRLLG